MREEFTKKLKAEAFLRAEGCCEVCHIKIVSGAQYDHIIPANLGGPATLKNCQVLCTKCHRIKTSTRDVPMIAKAKRIEAKRIGIRKPPTLRSRNTFQRYEPRVKQLHEEGDHDT